MKDILLVLKEVLYGLFAMAMIFIFVVGFGLFSICVVHGTVLFLNWLLK